MRGYYYNTETELYFLKTRYYDPEVGRFISPDSIEYLDPETINGLNLYAYCGNNPVMNIDSNGNFFLTFLLVSIGIGTAIGGAVAGVKAYNNGARGWDLVGTIAKGSFTGAVIGGIIGGLIAAFICAAPTIASFLSSSFSFGGFALASEGAAAITLTGAQIAEAGLAVLLGIGIVFSKNADRFGKSKLGTNSYYNKQFEDFWNQYGNGDKNTRRSFHDYITKKGYDTWKQLLDAWNRFINR